MVKIFKSYVFDNFNYVTPPPLQKKKTVLSPLHVSIGSVKCHLTIRSRIS